MFVQTNLDKDTGEEEARAPLSPSPRKRRQWTAQRSSPLRRPRVGSRRPPHSPPSPPTLSSGSGSIMSSPRIGEEDNKAPSSPSPRKRRQRTAQRSSPLRRHHRRRRRCHRPHLLVPLLLLLPHATLTHPLCPAVCIIALLYRLLVVSLRFVCPPALLLRCFRCSAALLAEVPTNPWPYPPRG